MRLRAHQKILARGVAHTAWAKAAGDYSTAVELAKQDSRLAGIDPAIVIAIIQLCIVILQYWMSNKIAAPSHIPVLGEPVNYELDD